MPSTAPWRPAGNARGVTTTPARWSRKSSSVCVGRQRGLQHALRLFQHLDRLLQIETSFATKLTPALQCGDRHARAGSNRAGFLIGSSRDSPACTIRSCQCCLRSLLWSESSTQTLKRSAVCAPAPQHRLCRRGTCSRSSGIWGRVFRLSGPVTQPSTRSWCLASWFQCSLESILSSMRGNVFATIDPCENVYSGRLLLQLDFVNVLRSGAIMLAEERLRNSGRLCGDPGTSQRSTRWPRPGASRSCVLRQLLAPVFEEVGSLGPSRIHEVSLRSSLNRRYVRKGFGVASAGVSPRSFQDSPPSMRSMMGMTALAISTNCVTK